MEYRRYTTPAECHKAFNTLYGILEGIELDMVINEKEILELEHWCDTYDHLARSNPFNDVISNIQVIISDNEITAEEMEDMKWLCLKFKDEFSYYDALTSDIQVLHGICHGILSDGIINDKEVLELNTWIQANSQLKSFFPFDEIESILTHILADGIIEKEEKQLLAAYLSEFIIPRKEIKEVIEKETEHIDINLICATDPAFEFEGNQFAFTGESSRGKRSEIAEIIQSLGGKFIDGVSSKTDVLIVGDNGNPCWTYACYGRKVEKAMQLRRKGKNILIVHDNDFWDVIQDHI